MKTRAHLSPALRIAPPHARRLALWCALALGVSSVACRDDDPAAAPAAAPTADADRLTPRETLPGVERAFGLELPYGMRVTSRFDDLIQASGPAPLSRVADHLRRQVVASHVELGTQLAVFPKVRVKGDPSRRLLRLEIRRHEHLTTVRLRDVTPLPATHGLSEPERWERAGRNPDGTLKDRKRVY